jgi:predicted PurR-regulated permease PerM
MSEASQASNSGREIEARVIETTIRLALVALLVVWCFQITRPFLMPIVWGIVIATAIHPAFDRIASTMGGRRRTAAALLTVLGLALLIVPAALLADSMVSSADWLQDGLENGTLEVPPPPEGIASWPVVGEQIHRFWALANSNLEQAIREVGPKLLDVGTGLLSAAAGVGLGVLQFAVSIVIAGVLLAGSQGGQRTAKAIATRLVGDNGEEMAELAGATVRSVAQGILGVALIQSTLLGIGMFVAGVPHASLWTALCLLLTIVQLPALLVMIPVIVYQFSVASTLGAVVFMIWSVLAGASDNVLKPILLGRGLDLPMIVIFLGSIGGFMMSGFIGLFVGAVVLALGYRLFMAWLALEPAAEPDAEPAAE